MKRVLRVAIVAAAVAGLTGCFGLVGFLLQTDVGITINSVSEDGSALSRVELQIENFGRAVDDVTWVLLLSTDTLVTVDDQIIYEDEIDLSIGDWDEPSVSRPMIDSYLMLSGAAPVKGTSYYLIAVIDPDDELEDLDYSDNESVYSTTVIF